jgi:hypothetical protein
MVLRGFRSGDLDCQRAPVMASVWSPALGPNALRLGRSPLIFLHGSPGVCDGDHRLSVRKNWRGTKKISGMRLVLPCSVPGQCATRGENVTNANPRYTFSRF